MKIKVTQDHIDAGFLGSIDRCPIALAMAEVEFNYPWVESKTKGSFPCLSGLEP